MRGLSAILIALMLALAIGPVHAQGLPGDPRDSQRLPPPQRQMLATIVRNAATASQLGALAGAHAEGGRLAELSHAMALTNGGLSQTLAQMAGPGNLPLRERLDEAELARLRVLAANDRALFGREVLGWITRHYPDTIRGVESLGRNDPRYAALAETTLPQLREQLAAAQELAQAAMEGEAPSRPH